MLNTASTFAAQGGLGEAASWIVLRQDIYVSLTQWKPLRISLESYKSSSAFTDTHDASWANRAIFLCGQVLDYALHADSQLDTQIWTSLHENLLHWHESVPWRRIGPYFLESPTVAVEDDPIFPDLWMTQSTHGKVLNSVYLGYLATDRSSSPWISALFSSSVVADRFCPKRLDAWF